MPMLYEYVREAQKFFPNGSNTSLLFLAGDHAINTTLAINSTTSHLLGDNPSQTVNESAGSRIHCSNEAKIVSMYAMPVSLGLTLIPVVLILLAVRDCLPI